MDSDACLFKLPAYPDDTGEIQLATSETPLWTRNKARFIARYLKTFTYVTKHGTYIDAFSGPQNENKEEGDWSAKLVLENEPAWLRNFYLFEKDKEQLNALRSLRNLHQKLGSKRVIQVISGDCNKELPRFLTKSPIPEKEATFCLLDQRSTECEWEMVKTLASYKGNKGGKKIELFYFLAQGWIDRTIKSWKNDVAARCKRWWGREDVFDFLRLSSFDRGRQMAQRFKDELGYKYAVPFPIQKDGVYGRIMFWMIHASDHARAPILMNQAYRHIGAGGGVNDSIEQLEFDIFEKG